MNVRKELQAIAPEFFAQALGEKSPALSAFVTDDGRIGRHTVHGLEWVGLISGKEKEAVAAWTQPLFGAVNWLQVRDDEGNVLSGLRDAARRTQIKVALVPSRRLGADDFIEALQPELFFFLQSLVRLGENLWILGDSGAEFELGCALVPDSHTTLVRPPAGRPPPFQTSTLASDLSLVEAMQMRDFGGYSTLVFDGVLGASELTELGQRNGVVLTERCTTIERALSRSGLLQSQELAQQLPSIATVVQLQRSATFGVQVQQFGEFRRSETGVDYIAVAARGYLQDARILAIVQQPETMQRLIEAGIDNVVLALSEAAPDDAMNVHGNVVGAEDDHQESEEDRENDFEPHEDEAELADIDHEDPGWELDAEPQARVSPREGLVQAPGNAGSQGMFRARPVVRPSTIKGQEPDEVEIGALTLDAPSRKIIIPEAPSGVHQKRTFAEIMRERHRFPPMSEKGPTLTPPVLPASTTADDDTEDDITPG